MWKAFGQRIQSRRKELGKTQVQCAERAGLERQQWLRIEHGAPTKQTTIMSIASALDLPEEEVLGWAGVTFGSPVTIAGGSIAVSRLLSYFAELPGDRQGRRNGNYSNALGTSSKRTLNFTNIERNRKRNKEPHNESYTWIDHLLPVADRNGGRVYRVYDFCYGTRNSSAISESAINGYLRKFFSRLFCLAHVYVRDGGWSGTP